MKIDSTMKVSKSNKKKLAKLASYGESLNDVLDRLLDEKS